MTLLSLDEARALLLADVAPVDAEILPLAECGGRTLAADIVADRDQPPEPVSAMDGYAVRNDDALAGARLRIIGEAPAGAPFGGNVAPETAVLIATGGVVPQGADRIVIQEIAARDGDEILDRRNARPQGAGREVYWRARLRADGAGCLEVTPDDRQDSSLQTPLASANALIRRLRNAPAAAAGDLAEVLIIGGLDAL